MTWEWTQRCKERCKISKKPSDQSTVWSKKVLKERNIKLFCCFFFNRKLILFYQKIFFRKGTFAIQLFFWKKKRITVWFLYWIFLKCYSWILFLPTEILTLNPFIHESFFCWLTTEIVFKSKKNDIEKKIIFGPHFDGRKQSNRKILFSFDGLNDLKIRKHHYILYLLLQNNFSRNQF